MHDSSRAIGQEAHRIWCLYCTQLTERNLTGIRDFLFRLAQERDPPFEDVAIPEEACAFRNLEDSRALCILDAIEFHMETGLPISRSVLHAFNDHMRTEVARAVNKQAELDIEHPSLEQFMLQAMKPSMLGLSLQ